MSVEEVQDSQRITKVKVKNATGFNDPVPFGALAKNIDVQLTSNNLETELKTIRANSDTLQTALTSEVNRAGTAEITLSKRMDSFTKLAEGSTTGDAELIDGRVGYDGTTYTNIGTAIRKNDELLDKDITQLETEVTDARTPYSGGTAFTSVGNNIRTISQNLIKVNNKAVTQSISGDTTISAMTVNLAGTGTEEIPTVADIAKVFDATKTYKINDIVWYNNVLYKCTKDITAADDFNSSYWTAIVLGNEVSELKKDLDGRVYLEDGLFYINVTEE